MVTVDNSGCVEGMEACECLRVGMTTKRGIVELLALTGQRREEVARLTWQELDLQQQVWTIPKSRTKNAKAHVVHLSEQSIDLLKRARRQGPLVFSSLGTKPFQEFSRAKSVLDQLSGVSGWRLHDLRRTCVSGMARLGVAPHVADKFLTTSPARSQGLRLSTSATSFSRSARRLWTYGEHIWAGLLGKYPMTAESI